MTKKFIYAPLLNRLFARFIDFFVVMFIFVIIGIPLYLQITKDLELRPFHGFLLFICFAPFVIWGYFIFMEYQWGYTIGKKLTGLRVISPKTGKLSLSNAILRTLCKMIPFNSLSILVSDNNVGWNDRIAETVVIREDYVD